MLSPLEFIAFLRQRQREAKIRFVVTSGQACVHYGIQQTTKDSDWIIAPEDLGKLRDLLDELESSSGWHAGYRTICGAPLEADYLVHGWTSHLLVVESSGGPEHHVDIFARPPRVQTLERDDRDPDFASRHVVAQMKKTDRDKDWPIVFGCGQQMWELGDHRGVLHFQDAEALVRAWPGVPEHARAELIRQRPLLEMIDREPQRLRRAIAIERTLWIAVNKARYTCYQTAWKSFYRRWRAEPQMQWPLETRFAAQHHVLRHACQRHGLPSNPLDDNARRGVLARAQADTAEIMAAGPTELRCIAPPEEILLP